MLSGSPFSLKECSVRHSKTHVDGLAKGLSAPSADIFLRLKASPIPSEAEVNLGRDIKS
jgi:hypothetical protein